MTFNFAQLVAHAATTRELVAGAIIGSGTVSNKQGNLPAPASPTAVWAIAVWPKCVCTKPSKRASRKPAICAGDTVRIEMHDGQGSSIFGAIEQTITHYSER
jgi:fumarylacetoacetate (FAA) hydrolase